MSSKDSSIEHGETFFLPELPHLVTTMTKNKTNNQPQAIRSVRVVGRCVDVNAQQQRMTLAHQGAQVAVDITLVADQHFAMDGLYQIIGELMVAQQAQAGAVGEQEDFVVRARVARAVDGMDMSLYEQSVRLRRAFLERNKGM